MQLQQRTPLFVVDQIIIYIFIINTDDPIPCVCQILKSV